MTEVRNIIFSRHKDYFNNPILQKEMSWKGNNYNTGMYIYMYVSITMGEEKSVSELLMKCQ